MSGEEGYKVLFQSESRKNTTRVTVPTKRMRASRYVEVVDGVFIIAAITLRIVPWFYRRVSQIFHFVDKTDRMHD